MRRILKLAKPAGDLQLSLPCLRQENTVPRIRSACPEALTQQKLRQMRLQYLRLYTKQTSRGIEQFLSRQICMSGRGRGILQCIDQSGTQAFRTCRFHTHGQCDPVRRKETDPFHLLYQPIRILTHDLLGTCAVYPRNLYCHTR